MFKNLSTTLLRLPPDKLGAAFRRYGWIGFWSQIVLGTLPILVLIYVLFFSPTASVQRSGMGLHEYLGLLGFFVLLFTTYWCYRYTRLGKRLATPDRRPPIDSVTQILWTGVGAAAAGIVFSMLLMYAEVGRLLYVFLRAPQGGAPVIQTQTYDPSTWASAIDIVALLADLALLTAEQIMVAITLWLLLRVTNSATVWQDATEASEAQ